MQAQIKAKLEEHGFIVVDTSFDNLQLQETIKSVVVEQHESDACAGLLYYFPDTFIYPRRIDPEKGCFFGITLNEGDELKPVQKRILEKHFPVEKIVIFTISNGNIQCRWYNKSAASRSSIDSFLNDLGGSS